jgi:hypothetical protein
MSSVHLPALFLESRCRCRYNRTCRIALWLKAGCSAQRDKLWRFVMRGTSWILGLVFTLGIGSLAFGQVSPELSATEGTLGSQVSIFGDGFGFGKGKVYLGGEKIKILSWADDEIVLLVTKPRSLGNFPLRIELKKPLEGIVDVPGGFTIVPPRSDLFEVCEGFPSFCLTGGYFGTKKGKILIVFDEFKKGQTITKKGKSKVLEWTMDPVSGNGFIKFTLPRKVPPGVHDALLSNKLGEFKVGRVLVGIPPSADLLPLPQEDVLPEDAYCRRKGSTLIVVLANQGNEDAPPSSTAVTFFVEDEPVERIIPTPEIPAGDVQTVTFPIPEGCYDPNCEFIIHVDAFDDVEESNNGNNIAEGRCGG